jgi:hypothetical protein
MITKVDPRMLVERAPVFFLPLASMGCFGVRERYKRYIKQLYRNPANGIDTRSLA